MKNELQTIEEKPISNQDAMLSMIERVAMTPDADIEKMERLVTMRNQELDRQAKQAFSRDFVQMKDKLPVVAKTKKNGQTNSNYAALEDVNQAIDPILSNYGFSTLTRIASQDKNGVTVEAVLWHKDGHTESTQVFMPMDKAGIKGTVNKTGVHATASSITYGKRVAICALLNISTGDDVDGNREQEYDIATTAQRAAIKNIFMKLNDVDRDLISKKFGAIEEIRKIDVSLVIASMNKIIKGYENA